MKLEGQTVAFGVGRCLAAVGRIAWNERCQFLPSVRQRLTSIDGEKDNLTPGSPKSQISPSLFHCTPLFLPRAFRISRRACARTIPSAATFRGPKRTGSGTTGGRLCSSAATLTIAREYPTMPAWAGERRSTHLAKVLKSPAPRECHLDLNRRVVDE